MYIYQDQQQLLMNRLLDSWNCSSVRTFPWFPNFALTARQEYKADSVQKNIRASRLRIPQVK